MENPYLPWQTPGLKMERKRTPLADHVPGASAAKQQRTPPVTKPTSESFIWRTRSLDDGRSRASAKSARSSSESSEDENKPNHEEEDLQQPLHSSFDASLLENDDFHSIFRVSKRRASDSGLGASWQPANNDLTPHSSGRKHLRQPKTGTAHKADEDELICPGTVRKLARHNSNESIKSKGTPVRPPTHWRPNVRAAAPNTGTQSLWKPPLIKFPLTPTAPNSTATTHPPTTQERRPLETTLEMDSVATNNSPSTTPFRFTSFPASLPRVHPPLREMQGSVPDSVRKRMFPPSTHHHAAAPPAAPNMNQSREEDGTQNTSISSLSTHGEEDPRMPPVHTRLFMEEEYAYSDDEEDDDDDDRTGAVGRTRLNFNLMLSPKMPLQKDESPFKDLGEAAQKFVLKMPYEDAEDVTAPTDLSRPYEQRHVHSFPSTMSSHSPLRSLTGCDDLATASTSGLTANGGDHAMDAPATQPSHPLRMPATPEEVQLHFQFDAVQCSPIPGIPEEEELRTLPASRVGKTSSRLPPKPHPTTSTTAATTTEATASTFKFSNNSVGKEGQQDDVRLSFSQESVSSSASAKLRRFRPMPDMSAFEMDSGSKNGQDRSGDSMSGNFRSPPPKLLCPPTPVRTPVWAHTSDEASGTGERPLLHHHRSNSLIITRVLATCSPQVMDPNYADTSGAMEGTSSAPAKTTADSAMEVDVDPTAPQKPASNHADNPNGPQHPEAPPPIRRSVGEMGSIISFATDFETLGILGKGAFADVYKVRCKIDNRLYAVKRNRRHFRGKRDRDIALAEVRSMQRLQQHSHQSSAHQQHMNNSLQYLLFFYRAWQEDGHFFCQTELCCRDTCRELMDSLSHEWCVAQKRYPSFLRNLPAPQGVAAGSPLDVNGRLVPNLTVWKICHDICAGLSHIHARGLVHNDIKPSNIFFVAHGERGSLCKIGDFGMTGAIGTSEDGQEGDSMYMAPELLSSGVKHASADIFSLGLTMYELAAGYGFDLPKQGPRWHELRNGSHLPELPSSREPILGHLIQQMISASPEKRPCADAILKHEKVQASGRTCDHFLGDYIKDIEDYDKREEERLAAADQMAEDQTPRTGANGVPCRDRVCSPTLGHFTTTAAPNMMFSPQAQ